MFGPIARILIWLHLEGHATSDGTKVRCNDFDLCRHEDPPIAFRERLDLWPGGIKQNGDVMSRHRLGAPHEAVKELAPLRLR